MFPLETRNTQGIDPDRRRIVEAARETWIRRLIDESRRNSLLFYRDLKAGTLEVTNVPGALEALLDGASLRAENLVAPIEVPDEEDPAQVELIRGTLKEEARREARKRLTTIRRKALSNLEEKGLNTLYLALGMATWPADDGGRPYEAPVLLLPTRLRSRGRSGADLDLSLADEPQANLILFHVLENSYGFNLDPDEFLAVGTRDNVEDRPVDPEWAYAWLRENISGLPGFEIQRRAILGNFAFQKMAMVRDLRRHADELVRHPVIAAIAGDQDARDDLKPSGRELDPEPLDERSPDDEHLVLDADSSQHRAITLALDGQNGVIQGPPGTGKSQTIANVIAEFAARGRRVLFVAEKRAALDAVLKRLRENGLGHLTLDLHGASISRKEVMARIQEALEQIRESTPVDCSGTHREFENRRKRLNEHTERMHAPREPAEESVHYLQGLLLRMPEAAHTQVRWRGERLFALTPERMREIRQLLVEAAGLRDLFLGVDSSPWNDAVLATGAAAQQALDRAGRLAHELWPAFDHALSRLAEVAGLYAPTTLKKTKELLAFLGELDRMRETYSPELFGQDLDALEAHLQAAEKGRFAALWAFLSDADFRSARKTAREMRSAGPAPVDRLLTEVRRARVLRERWTSLSDSPIPGARPEAQSVLAGALGELLRELEPLSAVLAGTHLPGAPLDEAAAHLRALAADAANVYRIPRVHEIRRQLDDAGLTRLIAELRPEDVPPEVWPKRFEYAWLHSVLDRASADDPRLPTFNGRTHGEYVRDFVRLDEERLRLAADRVRRLHGERAIEAMNRHPDQYDLVKREANKSSSHIRLRRLLANAPDVLTQIAPCWVASPLSVSELLDAERRHFDVVLFDEASQILPEEAVPAILRGDQMVVAGDRHQLPPTTFFSTAVDEEMEEELEAVAGFESLLDIVAAFLPNWLLRWHYRSHDERLIAFSNHYIYDDRLITFPSAGDADCIEHVLVPHDPGLSGQEQSSSPEVDEVVRRVLRHAEERPGETLGVIAMGIRHANRIQEALDRDLQLRPDISDYFSLERHERFFIKNLERVQGDERDAILLSIGYGKRPDGTLPHRFGPLTHRSGHRRLNVAVTRARRRITVVSSFSHHDVDLSRSGSRGVELLRAYLEYAAAAGRQLPTSHGQSEVPLNPFEADIKDALEARGVPVIPQWGASRYRIDLVAQHPSKPGRLVLAIECDGKSYHSTSTARDRDRLRQQQLERLGWRFHRIWSTDWFTRREDEIERAWAAYEDAVGYADVLDAQEKFGAPPSEPEPGPETLGAKVPSRRDPPRIQKDTPITAYTQAELRRLAEWALSDGRLRTDEDLMRDMLEALGFRRLGARIRRRFADALADARERTAAEERSAQGRLRLVE